MRRAGTDFGWVTGESSDVCGVALGFDFCHEHECGAEFFKEQMGIAQMDFPQGIESRTQTKVPQCLEFLEYTCVPKDKRRKATMPGALLYCTDSWRHTNIALKSLEEKIAHFEVKFYNDWFDKYYKPATDDFASAWGSRDGFAIHVRGTENVAKLKALLQAFQACDIALADPSIFGFVRRSLSFIQVSKLSDALKAKTLADDQAHKHLHDCAKATGIEEVLTAAGKGWYGMSPRWRNGPDSELLFFMNPREQSKYGSGWFTVQELQEWAQDKGPVVDSPAILRQLKASDVDWGIHLLRGLNAQGIQLNSHEKFVWLDTEKTKIGVRLLVSNSSTSDVLKDGTYPLEQLQPYLEAGRAVGKVPVPA